MSNESRFEDAERRLEQLEARAIQTGNLDQERMGQRLHTIRDLLARARAAQQESEHAEGTTRDADLADLHRELGELEVEIVGAQSRLDTEVKLDEMS